MGPAALLARRMDRFLVNKNVHNNNKRDSANAVPTNRNYTTELSAFGIIAGVNPAEVQWSGLALGPPPT